MSNDLMEEKIASSIQHLDYCDEEHPSTPLLNKAHRILKILRNPMILTPLADLGLQPATLKELSKNAHFVSAAVSIAAGRGLSESAANDIDARIEPYDLKVFELARLYYDVDLGGCCLGIDTQAHRVQKYIQQEIKRVEARIENLETGWDNIVSPAHRVTVTLPTSLKLLNDPKKIRDAAKLVLHHSFSVELQNRSENLANSNVINLGIISPVTHQEGNSFSLEFEVAAHFHEPKNTVPLTPMFESVAIILSGNNLSKRICARLNPIYPDCGPLDCPKWIKVRALN